MKYFFSALLLLTVSIGFYSCESEPVDPVLLGIDPTDPTGPTTPATASFKATVNGTNKVASQASAIYNETVVNITGVNPDGSFITISLPGNSGVGTYTIPDTEPTGFAPTAAYSATTSGSAAGFVAVSDGYGQFADIAAYTDNYSVTITEVDTQNHTISGTFRFTGVRFTDPSNPTSTAIETVSVTNGEFTDISYNTAPPTTSGNAFAAKIDGQNFAVTSISAYSNPAPMPGMSAMITISGRKSASEAISISMPANITAGTYTTSAIPSMTGSTIMYTHDATPTGTLTAVGNLTIISHDTTAKKIKGSFNGTASPLMGGGTTYAITDGTFEVTYQ